MRNRFGGLGWLLGQSGELGVAARNRLSARQSNFDNAFEVNPAWGGPKRLRKDSMAFLTWDWKPGHLRLAKASRRAFRCGLTIILAGSLNAGLRVQAVNEYQVKAAFLYNFAKFVEWPDPPAGPSKETLTLCIVGQDPFGDILDQVTKGKTVNGRELAVRRLTGPEEARSCQMVFIAASERRRIPAILEGLKRADVLTVGETESFAQLGGVINFVLQGDRVHFEINLDAAERAGLRISSKLLSLAKIVRDPASGGKG